MQGDQDSSLVLCFLWLYGQVDKSQVCLLLLLFGKWFDRGISYMFSVIVRVRVVLRKTVLGDWRFDYLSSSHLQSQVMSRCQIMVFIPLVVVEIAQRFCRDVIGRQNVKVAVTGRLLSYWYFWPVYCLLRYVGFVCYSCCCCRFVAADMHVLFLV